MKSNSQANRSRILNGGSVTSTSQLGLLARMPDMVGTQPMLIGDLSDEMRRPNQRVKSVVSAEVIQGSEQQLYSIRLQIGASLICWIADPYSATTHRLFQTWLSAGHMFVGLQTRHGVLIRTRPVTGELSIGADSTKVAAVDTRRFLRSANDAATSGLLKACARSEIDSVQAIRKVRAFLI